MRRTFYITAFASLAILGLSTIASAQSDEKKPRVGFTVTIIDFTRFDGFMPAVGLVPPGIRTVPVHPDDSGAGNPVLIPQTNLDGGSIQLNSFGIGPNFNFGRVKLRASIEFSAVRDAGDSAEKNYKGSGRTSGAALVYYQTTAHTGFKRPGFVAETKYQLADGFSLLAGYKFVPYQVALETGWDRYDSFESRDTFSLAENKIHEPYIGLGLGFVGFIFGPAFNQVSQTDLSRSLNLTYPSKSWGFAVTASAGW